MSTQTPLKSEVHHVHPTLLPPSALSLTTLHWFLENCTKQVSEAQRELFIELKNSIEGWKKGTMVRACKAYRKSEADKVRENISLYLNQLTSANYASIFPKIKNEMEDEWIGPDQQQTSFDILFDIMFTNTIIQPHANTVLTRLNKDLHIQERTFEKLREKVRAMSVVYVDTDNYDTMCIANKNNLIFKHCILFLANNGDYLFSDLEQRIQHLLKDAAAPMAQKEQVEGYVDCYITLLKEHYTTLTREDARRMDGLLQTWKSDKQLFTNRARFMIYDFYDALEAKGVEFGA